MNRQRSSAERVWSAAVVLLAAAGSAMLAGPPADWTQWGGTQRNFKVHTRGLASRWPVSGPPRLWTREFGEGYSAVLYEAGQLYTMYREDGNEVVVALDAASGVTQWKSAYPAEHFDNQTTQFGGGPNAAPLIVGEHIYTVGFTSILHCTNKRTGKLVWSHDLVAEFGARKLQFGYASSPVLHEKMVVVLLGGDLHGAMGFDLNDGSVRWSSEPLGISYASPRVIEVDGQPQLVMMSDTEVIGINLEHGGVEWRHPHENQYKNNCSGPWWGDDNLLFVSSQGDAGGRTLKLTRVGGKTIVKQIAQDKKMKIFHNSGIWLGEYLYAGSHDFVAAHHVRTGKTVWREPGFSEVNMLYADGKVILLDENGQLALADATPEGLTVHSKIKLLEKPAWTVPTLAGTRLFVRGKTELMALDLSADASEPAPSAP